MTNFVRLYAPAFAAGVQACNTILAALAGHYWAALFAALVGYAALVAWRKTHLEYFGGSVRRSPEGEGG